MEQWNDRKKKLKLNAYRRRTKNLIEHLKKSRVNVDDNQRKNQKTDKHLHAHRWQSFRMLKMES